MSSHIKTAIFFSVLIGCICVSQSDYLSSDCGTNGNYTNNSIYKKNLDRAFDNLISVANTSNSGFYNASVGEGSNRVYTLVLCRGDAQPDICRSCVKDSINMLKERCPNRKEATEWYQDCLLRYSNSSILNTLVTEPTRTHRGDPATDRVQFDQDRRDMLDSLKERAIEQKFATAKQITPNHTIYGLMQCTPDLSTTQCSNCLDKAIEDISSCCGGRIGGQVLKPSCRLRFEVAPFYDGTPSVDIQTPPAKPPPAVAGADNNKKQTIIIIVVVIAGTVTLLLVLFCIYKRKGLQRTAADILPNDMVNFKTIQSIQYNFGTLEVATNCFSGSNKLGQGGFGAVYKGTLQNGEKIAVKRLSTGSNQGQQEFTNEVIIVAELQHRNLVRLHGYCYEGIERLLVYELLPNASLDHFILDSAKRTCMNWEIRYKIIDGVARGLLYLHQDSRQRIIHRDLKASNVLLDAEMNPKIADFGMAKLFNLDATHGSTSKIAGTYGYMAPEYAKYGKFSFKSDVFSFGVLLLEIITGQMNHNFRNGENVEDLLSFAWKNWRDGTSSSVIDPILIENSVSVHEMTRAIYIGLLCVQANVAKRPTMDSVVFMLNNYSLSLAAPSEPAFFLQSTIDQELPLLADNINSSAGNNSSNAGDQLIVYSVDRAPITDLFPR